jgi:hypothetical protein
LVIRYNHVGNEVTTVQSRGRTREFEGKSILLAMKIVLERELVNQRRAELMKLAVEGIRKMTQPQFIAAINNFRAEIFQAILLADGAEKIKREQFIQYEIVCSLCRQVLVESTNVRTIYGKNYISIDRKIFKKVEKFPISQPTRDGILVVGGVKCLGQSQPGRKCFNKVGQRIKYKDTYYITLGIKNIGFNIGNTQEIQHFNKWKKVPFHIEELSDDDTLRYLNDTRSLRKNPDTAADHEEDSDDDSDDNDDDVDDLDDRIKSVLGYKSGAHETEGKKPY